MQYRLRKCLTNNPGPGLCQGRRQEERLCIETDYKAQAAITDSGGGGGDGDSASSAVAVVVASAVAGCLLGNAPLAKPTRNRPTAPWNRTKPT